MNRSMILDSLDVFGCKFQSESPRMKSMRF